ncbi:MAG: FAD-dependent oxidoreductase [Candidatus Pacebacteria bacterium]|nr:FAD-dependent oxidoreductase [Candidatus Paceibacterota bacterium]
MKTETKQYDLIIMGAGPAAYTAAIYAKRYGIDTLIIGEALGGLAADAHKICNFPSKPDVSGMDLMRDMLQQVQDMDVPVVMDTVIGIENKHKEEFVVSTMNKKEFRAKNILLTIGTKRTHLGLDREQEFLGRGVSYCATCDAMFYRNKTAIVVGGGNSAHTASLHLAEVAKKVYQIYRGPKLKGEPAWIDQVEKNDKVEVLYNTNVIELLGDEVLEGVCIDKERNGKDTINTDGLFIEIGSQPDKIFSERLGLRVDAKGHINVDVAQKTSVSGVWAAGDITTASNGFRQIITACSEGAIAAESIFQDLQKTKNG